jgi:hypothetical protein
MKSMFVDVIEEAGCIPDMFASDMSVSVERS